MPDINLGNSSERTGLELAGLINANKKVPFLFTTAFSDKQTITKSSNAQSRGLCGKASKRAVCFAAMQTPLSNFRQQTKPALPSEKVAGSIFFYNKVGTQLLRVAWADVYAIVATKNYVKLLTPDNRRAT